MTIQVNQILKNGTIENMKSDAWVSGFILGALENGFSLKMPGSLVASKGKLRIYAHTQGDNKQVTFMVGNNTLKQLPLTGFQWMDVDVRNGGVYYNYQFIGPTK